MCLDVMLEKKIMRCILENIFNYRYLVNILYCSYERFSTINVLTMLFCIASGNIYYFN